jgi:AcrR family transcriptional regulator
MASVSPTRSRPRPRRRSDGERSHEEILSAATKLATVRGLEGLSIGALAVEIGMSKSGLYAHFGAKQDLQLATVQKASEIFLEQVVKPALQRPRGIARLRAACEQFLDHVERKVFPGGCFFASTAAELDTRPGPVRDRIAAHQREWIGLLERLAQEAVDAGELERSTDPAQLAFELNAVMVAANAAFLLHRRRDGFNRARAAIDARFAAV